MPHGSPFVQVVPWLTSFTIARLRRSHDVQARDVIRLAEHLWWNGAGDAPDRALDEIVAASDVFGLRASRLMTILDIYGRQPTAHDYWERHLDMLHESGDYLCPT